MWVVIFVGALLVTPYAILKAFELKQRKENKSWSDDEADVIENWKFPSNYMWKETLWNMKSGFTKEIKR